MHPLHSGRRYRVPPSTENSFTDLVVPHLEQQRVGVCSSIAVECM